VTVAALQWLALAALVAGAVAVVAFLIWPGGDR
jgi:hypothetical protein